jgi:TetR/AcrR family transcriptional repressor of nem operon
LSVAGGTVAGAAFMSAIHAAYYKSATLEKAGAPVKKNELLLRDCRYLIARRVLGSPERADDAIESCWLRASRYPRCFEYEGAFRSWMGFRFEHKNSDREDPLKVSQYVVDVISVRMYSYVMRYSADHKAKNHEKILSMAARTFRERGGDSSGIGTVMKKVGLGKGGFYRHFQSKDDLFVEAVARAFDEMGSGMLEVAKSAPKGQALRAMIERYLSTDHANSPGIGCVIAALGPELARKPLSLRKRIEASLDAYRERLLPFVPGQTREHKLAKFKLLFSSMAGVLTMVRVTSSPQGREQMLKEAREFFVKSFTEK